MNKIPSRSLLKGGLTALLICAISVVDQAKMSVNKTLTRTPPKIETPKNKEVVPYIEEMETQYETYCMIENGTMLYDSLLSNEILSDLSGKFNRKEYQDSLFSKYPQAKPFAATIKTGSYLREAKNNYKKNEDIINTFLPNGWGFSRYQKFNWQLTQHGWKTETLNKDEFLFINDTYISFLISFIQKNPEFKPIIVSGSKNSVKSEQKTPPSGMFATVRDTIREQDLTVGGKKIRSKNYPAEMVYDSITQLGHTIYSSKDGEITPETPDGFTAGCTALTGVQLDIIIPGIEGLRQKIWEELEKIEPGKWTIEDVIFTLRGLAEAWHSFSLSFDNKTYMGLIGGQMYHGYNNTIKVGGYTSTELGRINSIAQLYNTHGRGTAVDIGIDAELFRAIQIIMKKLPSYKIGTKEYKILDLGNGLSALLLIHGAPKKEKIPLNEDLRQHLHCGFVPNQYLR